jgi:hypothetical protein
VSRSTPDCVFGQDPHEDVTVCGKGEPRNDCSAILSKGCITALLSESSPEVDTYPSRQLISMGEKAGNNKIDEGGGLQVREGQLQASELGGGRLYLLDCASILCVAVPTGQYKGFNLYI